MTPQSAITIYTDGGAMPNPGPGGWGAVILAPDGARQELSGAEDDTTNNRMELTAAVEALRALPQPSHVMLHTDSLYLRNGITKWLPAWVENNWETSGGKPVKNQDLWRTLHHETRRHTIEWRWVKGHAGNVHNERVDRLATQARERLTGPPSRDPAPAATASDIPLDIEVALRVSVPTSGGRGGWAARIRDARDGSSRVITGAEAHTSSNRLVLIAARAVLDDADPEAGLHILCPDDYLHKGMTEWLPGWQKRGWRTAAGKPVKNADAWQALLAAAGDRPVVWRGEPRGEPLGRGLDALARQAVEG